MQVIPVIDLQKGIAVHAVRGERHRYAPVRRIGIREGNALELSAFYAARKPVAIYVADLDSIQGGVAQIDLWKRISQIAQCPLWIDFGVQVEKNIDPFLELLRSSNLKHRLILASETLTNSGAIKVIAEIVGAENVVLSLDRKAGEFIANSGQDESAMLTAACEANIRQVIALDLATVGTGGALSMLDSWKPLLSCYSSFDWFLGGGIRDQQDLSAADGAGFHGVLAATAILKGSL